jgi:TPR repeat protein
MCVGVLLPGGPASRAGLQPGDVLLAIDGADVPNTEAIDALLVTHHPGEQVEVIVLRQGTRQQKTVTLMERPVPTEWIRTIRQQAEQGDGYACFLLGGSYWKGSGVEKDPKAALPWVRRAADKGLAQAQYNLGVAYLKGEGLERNAAEALKWFRLAAEQGDAHAQNNLAVAYLNGEGAPRDTVEGLRWLRKPAEQGLAEAQLALAQVYLHGVGVEKDEVEAVKWMRKAAEQGLPQAQCELGVMYRDGLGIGCNDVEAVTCFREAALRGYPDAQVCLAIAYGRGQGVIQDWVEAARWARKAADQGFVEGQFRLGVCLLGAIPAAHELQLRFGLLFTPEGEAALLCSYAGCWVVVLCCREVGFRTCWGTIQGAIKDPRELAEWFDLLAKVGAPTEVLPQASDLYLISQGVIQKPGEGIDWLKKAAEQGHAEAQRWLGKVYQDGPCWVKDRHEAIRWFRLAAAQGDAEAKQHLHEAGVSP